MKVVPERAENDKDRADHRAPYQQPRANRINVTHEDNQHTAYRADSERSHGWTQRHGTGPLPTTSRVLRSQPDRQYQHYAELGISGRTAPSPAAATASRKASRCSAITWWSTVCSASRGRYTGVMHPIPLGSAPPPPCPCPEMDTPDQDRVRLADAPRLLPERAGARWLVLRAPRS